MRSDRFKGVRLRRTPPDVCIDIEALELGNGIAGDRLPHETGGILLGWQEESHIHIDRFLEVLHSNPETMTYERNHGAAQAALKAALVDLPGGSLLGYVGEWHTHPAPERPSRQDRKEIKAIGRRRAQPVALVVFAACVDGKWTTHALVANGRTIRKAAISTNDYQ